MSCTEINYLARVESYGILCHQLQYLLPPEFHDELPPQDFHQAVNQQDEIIKFQVCCMTEC